MNSSINMGRQLFQISRYSEISTRDQLSIPDFMNNIIDAFLLVVVLVVLPRTSGKEWKRMKEYKGFYAEG